MLLNKKIYLYKLFLSYGQLRKKILHLKEIYKFPGDHFFIRVWSFFYYWKMLLKIVTFGFQTKLYEIRKKCWEKNCSSQWDIQIYFRALFYLTRNFCYNCKKCYQKWKILFCIKSVRDTKKMLRKKIICYKKIYKWACDHFFIRVISFHFLSKTLLWKSKVQFSRQNIRDKDKMLRNNIFNFKRIYNFDPKNFFIGAIFFVYYWKILLKMKKTSS